MFRLKAGLAACSNGIKAQLILCCMRGADNDELNNETIRMAKKYLGQGVCAADLAGAEALFPTSKYRELFAYAKELGVPFTIHAGEADGVESMRLAIEYGAQRIGHGIRSWNDNDMKALLIQKDICLTLCPSSNLQTKAIVDGVANSPKNPFWIGERTEDTLPFGKWTMDIDVVTNKVKAFNSRRGGDKAYSMVLVGGALWCPDCVMADHHFYDYEIGGVNQFRTWAKEHNIAYIKYTATS